MIASDGKRTLWGEVIPFLLNHREVLGRFGGWFALLGFLLLTWLANSTTTFVQHLADPLWDLIHWQPAAGIPRAAAELAVPTFVFGVAILVLRIVLRREQSLPDEAVPRTIQPHHGLLGSLSVFAVPRAGKEAAAELRHQIEAAVVGARGTGAESLAICQSLG